MPTIIQLCHSNITSGISSFAPHHPPWWIMTTLHSTNFELVKHWICDLPQAQQKLDQLFDLMKDNRHVGTIIAEAATVHLQLKGLELQLKSNTKPGLPRNSWSLLSSKLSFSAMTLVAFWSGATAIFARERLWWNLIDSLLNCFLNLHHCTNNTCLDYILDCNCF